MDCNGKAEDNLIKEEWSTLFKPKRGNYSSPLGSPRSTGRNSSLSGWQTEASALQFCTEGLGFESSDETDSTVSSPSTVQGTPSDSHDRLKNIENGEEKNANEGITAKRHRAGCHKFPPPLPSIGRNGQQGVLMKSYKKDGRFVLQEVKKVPPHEVLRAWRRDGRLKLHLVQKEDDEYATL